MDQTQTGKPEAQKSRANKIIRIRIAVHLKTLLTFFRPYFVTTYPDSESYDYLEASMVKRSKNHLFLPVSTRYTEKTFLTPETRNSRSRPRTELIYVENTTIFAYHSVTTPGVICNWPSSSSKSGGTSANGRANPKSAIFTHPLSVNRRFETFKSRCMT